MPTVIDRAWETGRAAIFKIINQQSSWEVCHASRNESARAQARLQLETPISDDASLPKLQEQVADYVREAKHRDPSEPNELISTVLDEVARDYFRHHAILKQRRACTPPKGVTERK
jgi:hypothetical protein